METKAVKNLQPGDLLRLTEPNGVARLRHIERSRMFQASGGCFRLGMTVVAGPNKGEQINDQHHAGDHEVEIAGADA